MGRPTDDKKPSNLIVRVNDETKDRLRKEAKSKGITVSEYIRDIIALHNGSIVMQKDNNVIHNESNVMHLEEQIRELEKDNSDKQDFIDQLASRVDELVNESLKAEQRIEELEFLNDADYVDQLRAKIEELNSEIAGLRFLVPEYRDEVEKMAEMTCGVENFYKSVLEKVEREEMDFNENGFELTDTEVVEALRNNEIREQLEDMRKGCEEKQVDKVKAMTRALKQGLVKVRGEIWGIKN